MRSNFTLVFSAVTSITLLSGGASFQLASLLDPTEAQKQLSATCNTIAIGGTGALCVAQWAQWQFTRR
ncbi:MAG: hypothetical protein HC866_18335 [Leptolyngbyaceae cyanobacterium RU_5_1]|nr:hypothetical protein [Leptolyngbyaceae cyanobacterium RU_5_1]